MCNCIEELNRLGYVHRNIMKNGQYFLYSVDQYKKVTKQSPLLVKRCPECGGMVA